MRLGRKKRPFYRIVAVDSRKSRNGQYIEKIGHFDPVANDNQNKLLLDKEKAISWLQKGAIASVSAKKLLSDEGIIAEFNETKSPRKKKKRRKGRGNPMSEKIKLREELKIKEEGIAKKKEIAKKKKAEEESKIEEVEKTQKEGEIKGEAVEENKNQEDTKA